MFSRKKKNYTWLWVCSILAIMIFAVLLLIGSLAGSKDEDALRASLERSAEQRQDFSEPVREDSSEDEVEENTGENSAAEKEPAEDNRQNQFYQSYYLVKYDNNVIKIFFSDETGNLVQLEETAIIYQTLSPEDQKRFREGIKVENRDDLNSLIMNYES